MYPTDILWEVILFCPDNCLATENIQYRWDRITWCVGFILQRELWTPGVIALCHKMTLHMSLRGPLYDVNKILTKAFHYIIIQLSFHNPNTDIVLVRWPDQSTPQSFGETSLLHFLIDMIGCGAITLELSEKSKMAAKMAAVTSVVTVLTITSAIFRLYSQFWCYF